MNYKAQQKIW